MSGSNDHDQSSDSSNDDEEEGEEEEEEENCGENSDSDLGACLCQENTGCLTTSLNCGGYRPSGTAATGACPGPCQCAEEEAWNSITPPRPNYRWFNNFVELRRQWSDHARTNCYRFDQSRKSKALYKHPLPTQKCALPTNHSSIPADSPAHSIKDPCHELETNSSCCHSGSHDNYNKHRNHGNGVIMHGHHNHKNGHTIHDQHNCHTGHVTPDRHSCQTGHVTPDHHGCHTGQVTPDHHGCHTDHVTPDHHGCHTDHVTHDHRNHKKNPDTHSHHGREICHDDLDTHDKTPSSGHENSLPSEQSYPRSVKTEKKFSPRGRIPGGCLCQPMPRSCNCPPPVKIDARANPECTCECPSSPECPCPPSERRFSLIKSICPHAKLCRPTPRLPPGPKCHCTKCQPPLPVPCDPCTVSKCRVVKRKACWVDKKVCGADKTDQEVDKAEPQSAEHLDEVKIEADQVNAEPVDQVEEISVDSADKEEPVDKVEVIAINRSVGKNDFEEEKPEFSCKKVSYHDSVEVKEEIDDLVEISSTHEDDKAEALVIVGKEAIDVTNIVGKEAPEVTDSPDKVETSEKNVTDVNSCPERCGERCLAKCRAVQTEKCPKYRRMDSVGTKCSRKIEKVENLKNDEISKEEKNQESSDDNLLEKNSLGDWTFVDVEHSKRPIKLLKTINRAKVKRKQRNCDCEPEFDYVIIKFIRKISTDSIIIINKIFKKSDDQLENLSIKSSNLSNYLDDHEIISTMDLMSRPLSTI
ncbi:uncharacterized protein LOC130674664 [Microplitis mediator]|uniref:uncharacterized protein LOC130674664 n=1 Tax=Microplitis mediator TaxID=375433 RepID=UPI00255471F1|nr:uncharacterized protein LOC130674664 [Microplitis mediator]